MKELEIRLGCGEATCKNVNVNIWGCATKVRGEKVGSIEPAGYIIREGLRRDLRRNEDEKSM